jgi:hypothetical protein
MKERAISYGVVFVNDSCRWKEDFLRYDNAGLMHAFSKAGIQSSSVKTRRKVNQDFFKKDSHYSLIHAASNTGEQ